MLVLNERPEEHFSRVDYLDSELLVSYYKEEQATLLFCIDDASEKGFDWINNLSLTDYFFRYKVFSFKKVGKLRWVLLEHESTVINFSSIDNPSPARRLEEIDVVKQEDGYLVKIAFDTGSSVINFKCEELIMFSCPFYIKKNEAIFSGRYYIDKARTILVDERQFLIELSQGLLSNVYRVKNDY